MVNDVPELAPLTLPQKVVQDATAFMHARTVAFWGHHDVHSKGEPKQYGSGVLLQIADRRFLASAEHVCRLFLDQGCSAFLGAGADKLIQIDQASVRRSAAADVAILTLSDKVCAAISPDKRFIRLDEVDTDDPTDEAGGIYCAFGYPSDASDTDHQAKLHTMIAQHCFGLPYPKTTELIPSFDARIHIAIEFDRTAHPAPGGMSGGGIWRINQAGVPASSWSSRDIRLVAIEHTHAISGRGLIGTRVGYLATLIKNIDPSLSAVLQLQWPHRTRTRGERLVRQP